MARKIKCKNGRSFTYLTPQEKYEKYKTELEYGLKLDHTYKPKVTKGYNPIFLTNGQRKYREDYISSFEIINSKNNRKGVIDFIRDCDNYFKNVHYRNKK